MRLRELESLLDQVNRFEEPKINLEQYNTSSHLAARMIYTADQVYDDIENKRVADFGTGSGVLAIAAQILGSSYTVGFDIDEDALTIASNNAEEFDVDIDLVMCNIATLSPSCNDCFDTIVMNPPFGTRTKGIDVAFLEKALEMCTTAVYSLHKSSTRDFLLRKAQQWNVKVEVVAVMKFDLPKMYIFHKKKSVDVQVDLLRFSKQ